MNRWRVGEDIGSKETDGHPLTETSTPPLTLGQPSVPIGACHLTDNPNTTRTLEYTKDKYNVKIIK
jgi:hypothetical protein